MKIFVAASSQDRGFAGLIIEALNMLGHLVHDWTKDPGYDDPEKLDQEASALGDLAAVADAEGLIWILTEAPSTGAPLEVGYAHREGLPIVVLCPGGPPRAVDIYPHLFPWARSLKSALLGIS